MKRPISILLGFALLASTDAVLAGGGHPGGGRSAGTGASVARPGVQGGPVGHPGWQGVRPVGHPGWQGVRPAGHPGWQGVRPITSVHPQPGVVIRNHPYPYHHHNSHFFYGGTVILGAPFFFPPQVYVAPAAVYTEPPVYIEQASQVYYYCQDYRDYYPRVATCPSPWVQVLPEPVNPN